MEHIGANRQGINLSDLALQMGLPVSTTHRLLSTLEHHQFVTHDNEIGNWSVGINAFQIGNTFLHKRDITAQSRPFMQQLMRATGETVNLAVFEGGNAVIVSQVQSKAVMRMLGPIGSIVPLHASGVGKAFLSAMPEAQVKSLLQHHGLEKFTTKTLVTAKSLLANLREVKHQGHAIDDEERHDDLRCVAANIYDENQEVIAAISVSGPSSRINNEQLQSMCLATKQSASEITTAIGGQKPH